jgi:hypothetical protein
VWKRALGWCVLILASAGLVSCGATSKSRSSASPSPAQSVAGRAGYVLRPAPDARGCPTPRDVLDRRAPATIAERLSVLRLPRTSTDGVPVLNRSDGKGGNDTSWLPVHSVDFHGVRRVRDHIPSIYIIPSAGVLKLDGNRISAPCPSMLKAAVAPGACLVTGPPGGPFAVRCWTLAEIDRGRALMLVGAGPSRALAGLVPSGATVALSTGSGPNVIVRSADGVVDQPTQLEPGIRLLARLAG